MKAIYEAIIYEPMDSWIMRIGTAKSSSYSFYCRNKFCDSVVFITRSLSIEHEGVACKIMHDYVIIKTELIWESNMYITGIAT